MLFLRPLFRIIMQIPITITIESARFIETTLGVVSNALAFLLLLTMDCGKRMKDRKKGRAKNRSAFLGWVIF